jgi:hypothetical protein
MITSGFLTALFPSEADLCSATDRPSPIHQRETLVAGTWTNKQMLLCGVRIARAALGWGIRELAVAAKVSVDTVCWV